ncbi:antibiotic biosynthesis monooxygenase family protein [Photobacterium phosphoreum]|uniref:antibiotic biosynthesis monooxygenase family protein n=1 Tax=Photobacterium phosphoreum TaxID=659 RepID=UPI000D16AE90|nr:antibiotic biosynthesis monooxygenase [Photobacterium phosphoreum]PSU74892.1 antibiotic biosynthesis monooxygenase [Photobacterium phosphoreum]
MYIAMNRFKIRLGSEQEFINIWKNRETYLDTVPGFQSFNLLQSASNDEYTLFASHSVWDSRQAFEDWTQSEQFRKAHANARSNKEIYLGAPNFEGFENCL